MKRFIVLAFLLAGCATGQEPAELPLTMDEAYVNAQAIYISGLQTMVNFKNECGARPPELREECWPVVEKLRTIAKSGIEYRQSLDMAYRAGDQGEFNSSLSGLKMMRTAIIAEVSRESAKQKGVTQ